MKVGNEVSDHEVELAREAVSQAGDILKAAFGKTLAHKVKSKGIVTEFDVAAEEKIKEVLQPLGLPFLAEETSAERTGADAFWVIDPIDGTSNFAHGNPNFAISLALIRNGKLCLGIIANPINKEEFLFDGNSTRLNGELIGVTSTEDKPLVFLNYGYAVDDALRIGRVFNALAGKAIVLHLGPTALECAWVAAGRADIIITTGDEVWDYAGGIALVQGAGGKVCDWRGQPFGLDTRHIAAGNPDLVDELVPILSKLI